jgi:proline dehydrogenase
MTSSLLQPAGGFTRLLGGRARRAYVAGPGLADALDASGSLLARGITSTLGFWNSAADPPRTVADVYLASVEALGSQALGSQLAVKTPALGLSGGLVAEVVARSRDAAVDVVFDSLAHEDAEPTLSLALASARDARIGCTLPARWRRSRRDADAAVEAGLAVRVVKGQWPDPDGEPDLRRGFLDVVDSLTGRARQVGIATHDVALAREALRRLRLAGTRCELELLLGLPLGPGLRLARAAAVPVRVYVPYGHAYLPYAVRRCRRSPRVLWWAAQDVVLGPRKGRIR